MKYNVGDKVRINILDWYNENKNKIGIVELREFLFGWDRAKYCGKIMEIGSIKSNSLFSYYIFVEDDLYGWTDDMIECKVEEEFKPKFKVGDRVFNKVTRKWVNIIEFDIETGLYIVRYDDGIQGRSLESELCETRPSFKEIKEVVKKKAEVYINSKTELDGLSKSLLYEGFVDGMMTALIEMEE